MTEPVHHIFWAINLPSARQRWAVDHQHRQAQPARGDQLGFSSAATGVLADEQFGAMRFHELYVARRGKWPAINHDLVSGQGRRRGGHVDKTQQIMMLRAGSKSFDMHPAQSQHDTLRRAVKSCDGPSDVWDMPPSVSLARAPGRTGQSEVRNPCDPRSFNRVCADCRRERVGCIDEMGNSVTAKKACQPFGSPKPADTAWHWLRARACRTPGIAQRGRQSSFRQKMGQGTGLAGSAQHQDIRHD